LELQLALKPNPVLESEPEPGHGSRIGTKNVGKSYFLGKVVWDWLFVPNQGTQDWV
jgi:hypothetical protein